MTTYGLVMAGLARAPYLHTQINLVLIRQNLVSLCFNILGDFFSSFSHSKPGFEARCIIISQNGLVLLTKPSGTMSDRFKNVNHIPQFDVTDFTSQEPNQIWPKQK